jgi:S-layer protein (TIGR01567 family)
MVNMKYAKGIVFLVLILSLVYVAIAAMPTAIIVSVSPLNPIIAADNTRQFTASTAGTTTITITAANGTVTNAASPTPTVTAVQQQQVLTTVTILPLNPIIAADNTRQFTATTRDQNNATISANLSWSSSNMTVGTIDGAGLFNASTGGTTTITLTATNGSVTKTASTTATVTAVQQQNVLTTVTISPINPSIVANNTRSFTATTRDQNNATLSANLSWSSSNTTVGTIDSAGLFTASAAGTTTITVTATNGSVTKTASTTANVSSANQITVITISPATWSLFVGDTKSFTANDANVGWNSTNTTVGSIDNLTGVFTASAVGTTIITATNGSFSGNATVTVMPPSGPPPVTNLIVAGRGTTWINWTWENPTTGNFSNTLVKINGSQSNTSNNYFNYTQFNPGTSNNTIYLQTVDTSGNVNPTIISNTSYTLNTHAGPNVMVSPVNNVEVTFSQVDKEGNTLAVIVSKSPEWDNISSIGNFYDISTDSRFYSGNITVQLGYDNLNSGINESNIKLYHWNNTWDDVTTNLDIDNKTVRGNVTSLSPFVVGVPPGPKITVSPPVATNIETSGSDSRTFNISVSQDATVTLFWDNISQGNSSSVSAGVPKEFTYTSTSTPGNYTFSVTANNINGTDTASWNWTVRSKTYFKGNRVWNGAKSNEYSLDYTWDPLSFYAFYYDLDTGFGNEALKIHLNNYNDRSISAGSLQYSSEPYSVSFQQTNWGQYDVIGFMADKYFGGYTSDTKSITSTPVSPLNNNQLHKILMDDNTQRVVSAGSTLTLQEGYVIKIQDVDAAGRIVLLSLLKDGGVVDTQPVSQGGTYVYSKKVGVVNDLPIIAVRVENVFSGTETTAAFTKGIFQISESFTSTNSNNQYGIMEITGASASGIKMDNRNSFTLSQGSTIDIMGDLKFIVANNYTLRFAPMVQREGTYEMRGTIAQDNDTNFDWTPMNFEGFYYNLDDDVGTEDLSITRSGTTVSNGNLIYTTKPQAVNYKYSNFGTFNVIGFMADTYFAGYIGCPTCITKQDISTINYQQLHKVLIDDDTQRVIYTGSTLTLNDGYVVKIKDVSIGAGSASVWLSLLKDGNEIYSDVKNDGEIFTYAPSKVGAINDLPIIALRIDKIFRGTEATAAFAKGVFQISENYTSVKQGDNFGIMKVSEVSSNQIQMSNPSSFTLSSASTLDVMGNIKFKVANSDEVRFYPFIMANGTAVASSHLTIDAPATPMVRDTIKITVTDGTGARIENAEVSFDGNVVGNTNSTGNLDYILTKSGQHTITATRLGYDPATITIQVSEYRDTTLKFELPAILDQGIPVAIKVISNGTAISGANVTFDGKSIGLTGSDGLLKYTFDVSGTHNLGASKTGYITVVREISIRMPFTEFKALDINFTPAIVFKNQKYVVWANISNTGTKGGMLPVGLVVNDSVVDSQNVTLAPGATQEINFTQKMILPPGNYSIEILDQKKIMEVKNEPFNIFLIGGIVTALGAVIIYLLTAKNNLSFKEIRRKLKFGET